MNSLDEPKHTKAAAYITNIYPAKHEGEQDRLLVLWRNKWEDEGTPLILPGGGCLEGETPKNCAIREFEEETGALVDSDHVYQSFEFETKWTNKLTIFNLVPAIDPTIIKIDSCKFSGCLWIPVNNIKLMERLYPLCMHGLQQLMEYMKWV